MLSGYACPEPRAACMPPRAHLLGACPVQPTRDGSVTWQGGVCSCTRPSMEAHHQLGRACNGSKPRLQVCAQWLTTLMPCAVGLDHSHLARSGLLWQQPVRLGRCDMHQWPRSGGGLLQPGCHRPAGGVWPADRAHRPEPGGEPVLGCAGLMLQACAPGRLQHGAMVQGSLGGLPRSKGTRS